MYVSARLCGGSYPSHELKAYYQHLLQEDGLDVLRPAARLGIFASNFPGVPLYMCLLSVCVRILLAVYVSVQAVYVFAYY